MSDHTMKLRKFIEQLDQYIKELENAPNQTLDSVDGYALGYLAEEANQAIVSLTLYDLANKVDDSSITNDEYIKAIKELGVEYDI